MESLNHISIPEHGNTIHEKISNCMIKVFRMVSEWFRACQPIMVSEWFQNGFRVTKRATVTKKNGFRMVSDFSAPRRPTIPKPF